MSRHCPDFIDAYMLLTGSQEASPKMHRWTAISMIAGALERKVWLPRGHYTLFPNLYIAVIAPSGFKKSTATGYGVNLMRDLPTIKMMADRVTSTSLVYNLANSTREFGYAGVAKRQSATFIYTSEFLTFLKDTFGPVSEFLTTFYDCVPHDDSKPWIYETKGEGQKKIFGPCLNLLAASTGTWLAEAIPAEQMEGGFASRIIFVVENEPPTRFVPFPEDEPQPSGAYKLQLMSDFAQIHSLVGPVKLTPEAKAWYRPRYAAHQIKHSGQRDGRFTGYYSRKYDTVLKLAMVASVSESNTLVVDERHMVRALAWLDSVELTMFGAFAHTGRNHRNKDMGMIVEALVTAWTRHPGATIAHMDLLKAHIQNITHEDLMKVMEDLYKSGFVRAHSSPDGVTYTLVGSVVGLAELAQPGRSTGSDSAGPPAESPEPQPVASNG